MIVDATFPEESPVVTGFLRGGDNPASTTVVWTNLSGTVTVSASDTDDPTINAPNTRFTKTNSTGVILMDVVALSEMGGAFNPTNWMGGTTNSAKLHATVAGWGVGDDSGNGNIQAGEALILTFDFSSLGLAPDHLVKLAGFDFSVETAQVWKKVGADRGELVATGATPALSLELENGDELAIINSTSGAMRLRGLMLDVDEKATSTKIPEGLNVLAGDSAGIVDWNDDTTGFLDYYTVYRGTVSGSENYDFSTNVIDSAYLDTMLANGTTYYYALTATDTNGLESGYGEEVSATPFDASTDVVMIQNLDATNAISVTTNSAGEVTLWADLSGNGNDAEDGVGDPVLWPSTSLSPSGLAGMDVRANHATLNLFDASETDAFLNFSGAAVSNSGFCVMMAFKADSVLQGNGQANQIILGNSANFGDLTLRMLSTRVLEARLDGVTITKDANIQDGDFIVMALNYKANSGLMEFWDSKTGSVSSDTADVYGDFSSDLPLSIGGSTGTERILDGMIGEVKILSSHLAASEFEAEHQLLVEQWIGNGYDAWAQSFGLTGSDADPETDVEPDGLNNLMEYAFGGDPTVDDAALVKPVIGTAIVGGSNWFYHVHNERDDDSLTYTVELNADLVNAPSWATNGIEFVGQSAYVDSIRSVTNRTDVDTTEFIRLEVEK